MQNTLKNILIIMGRYLPGYKDGGPVRSIKNLTDYLGEEYIFRILTCDRDHGDESPYPNIKVNDWNRVGNADVYYVSPGGFTQDIIVKLAQNTDLVYVCGCFNDYAINTLIAKRLGRIKVPVFIASMGLFSPLEFKRKFIKKKLFVSLFNILGLFKNVYWSATTEMEARGILHQINTKREKIFIAEDLPRIVAATPIFKQKKSNELKIVWLSRIAPNKNLLGVIETLREVKGNISFEIYGSVHDKEYWEKCLSCLKKLSQNIEWKYNGNVDSEQVIEIFRQHHLFVFLSFGENYGHVIHEALSAGCPCILSDQTPWQDLEMYSSGYVVSLSETDQIVEKIDYYYKMSAEDFQNVVSSAHAYAILRSNDQVRNTGYRKIFDMKE